MKFTLFLHLLISLVVASMAASSMVANAQDKFTPDVASFSMLPTYANVQLSPNGQKFSYVNNFPAPHNISVLSVFDLQTNKNIPLLQSDNRTIKINWFEWANNDVVLVSAKYQTQGGQTKFYQTRLFSMDLSKKKIEPKQLLKPPYKPQRIRDSESSNVSQFQDSVVDFLPDDPEHILAEVDYDSPNEPSVYKVNVRSGKQKRIQKGKSLIRAWMTDQQHTLRIGRAMHFPTGEVIYFERKTEDDEFRNLFTYTEYVDQPITVLGFDLDPNILYFYQYVNDKQALYKMDLSTNEQSLVYANPNYDVEGSLIYSKKTGEAIGVFDAHAAYGRYYFDEKYYKLHRSLDKVFPDTDNYIVDMTADENIYVLFAESDSLPGQYYYGDRKEGSLGGLVSSYPQLEGYSLPSHEKITYKARDGVEIEGYLTLPLFGKAPYPTIIHPHGGPGARDYDGFDTWVAYMASRGYAVFRPNFRGSSGFGYEFTMAQMGRWGLEMQDDITDGTNSLVDQGIADPNKMCIFGASYGGYAAAMATVKTPDLFTCAVSFAGVSDLDRLARNQRRFVGGDIAADNQLGNSASDLDARSPISHVKKIKTPLLIMHGAEDVSVPVFQSRSFVAALESENKDVRYIEFEDGDHYLSIQENRDLFFKELDRFLTQHLGKVTP